MIFIVGNSRSGTTMLGRILGSHSQVFTFEELHFFEQMWMPRADAPTLDQVGAVRLAARLLSFQRKGILKAGDPASFLAEAGELISARQRWTAPDVFAAFLTYETTVHGKRVGCDQTPGNVYYLKEILNLYPEAKVIIMVRDPRDVLASQKKKWLMRFRGYNRDPVSEAIRLKINYHPITTSVLWKAAIRAGDAFLVHPRVRQVRFEDLIREPDLQTRAICTFLELPYEPEMIAIPQVNSSYDRPEPSRRGLNSGVAGRWQRGALTSAEVFICERLTREPMVAHGYAPANIRPNLLRLTASLLLFPFKAALAVIVNIPKRRSLLDSVLRRFDARE